MSRARGLTAKMHTLVRRRLKPEASCSKTTTTSQDSRAQDDRT